MIVYENGTPRTKHLVTNIIVEVDEEAGAAAARSSVTALQALPDLPPCNPSSAAATTTASSAATGAGASWSGACTSTSSEM